MQILRLKNININRIVIRVKGKERMFRGKGQEIILEAIKEHFVGGVDFFSGMCVCVRVQGEKIIHSLLGLKFLPLKCQNCSCYIRGHLLL